MLRSHGISATILAVLLLPGTGSTTQRARSLDVERVIASSEPGGGNEAPASASTIAGDTVWVADWTFDTVAGGCTDAGWTKIDYRIRNYGSNYWTIDTRFNGIGGIQSKAAILGKHDLTWVHDGYGGDWDYSIILKYRGASTLAFDYLSDSEPCCDYVHVETDSGGASEALVNYAHPNESVEAQAYRDEILLASGPQTVAGEGPLPLSDYGVPGVTHEVYIRFTSDVGWDDADGDYLSAWEAGLIVDNVSVIGALTYTENFEGSLNSNVTLANTAPAVPFGLWARLYVHATDNDKCDENPTCQWIFTDPTRNARRPEMAFGPEGGKVTPIGMDNIVVSPWVSLAGTLGAHKTALAFRVFGGNQDIGGGHIWMNWSVRAKARVDNTDTPAPGDSVDLFGAWRHRAEQLSAQFFTWRTLVGDMSPYLAGATDVQVRFRAFYNKWWWQDPGDLNPGPGPYLDRVRIGRVGLMGPVIEFDAVAGSGSTAEDCFATTRNSIAPGEHFSPSTDRFGTCAFSMAHDIGGDASANLITGDSITVDASYVGGSGALGPVRWYGAIVSGPHVGKAPAPYAVDSNSFFEVSADSCRDASGAVVRGRFFVDLDDTYFRGGDALRYFWTATDAQGGGRTSAPPGIGAANFPPVSVGAAEQATGGLFEVNFLPEIDWDPAYLGRLAADAHGDLDPTPGELANSSQRNCILYYNGFDPNRRSTDLNRTAFMYTLDRLGYRDHYDVYDLQGGGNSNDHLGGRADVAQCRGYALIIQDLNHGGVTPYGQVYFYHKIDQDLWYRQWLDDGANAGAPGLHTLWMIGDDTAYELDANGGSLLLDSYLGFTGNSTQMHNDQGLTLGIGVNPNVVGVASFTFTNGNVAAFGTDLFALNGGCPVLRDYDGWAATSGGTAVVTHKYASGATTGDNAVVMNKNATLEWNTIWQGFSWSDIRPAGSPQANTPDVALARTILNAALPAGCVRSEIPTDVTSTDGVVPRVSMLHQNVPNPFNPTTVVTFDLAHRGPVRLQIFDVAGRRVRTLIQEEMDPGFGKRINWNGRDEADEPVSSGVYFYRLSAGDFVATRKMVVLR